MASVKAWDTARAEGSAGARVGDDPGRRDRSSRPARPSTWNRRSHVCTDWRATAATGVIVRRRGHDLPEEERIRISTELSEVQSKLNHNRAVLGVEGPPVARAYTAFVLATREVAGESIRQGWNLAPITADTEVHVTDVDLSAIKRYEEAYLTAVADHLALTPWWLRASGRWLARTASGLPSRRRDPSPVPSAVPAADAESETQAA